MSTKLEHLILVFEQLETWDNQARQSITKADSSSELTTLERNMQHYQTLITQIQELAGAADDDVLEYLLSRLHHKNTMVRMHVISALGYTGRFEAIDPLAEVLRQETNDDVKAAVAQSLGFFGNRLATIPLIEVLQSDMTHRGEAKVRFACAQALSFIAASSTIDPLIETLTRDYGAFDSSVSDLREAARDALVSIGGETVIDKLIALWTKPQIHPVAAVDATIRNEIITAFGQIDHSRVLDFLLMLAHNENSDIREAVMSGLAYHRDRRSILALRAALDDVERSVREAAQFSLQRMGESFT